MIATICGANENEKISHLRQVLRELRADVADAVEGHGMQVVELLVNGDPLWLIVAGTVQIQGPPSLVEKIAAAVDERELVAENT